MRHAARRAISARRAAAVNQVANSQGETIWEERISKEGQSAQQQTSDRDQCYRWAMDQIGSDQGRLSPGQTNDYYRAMESCLDARGYSVR
jgi:hypothetical protein